MDTENIPLTEYNRQQASETEEDSELEDVYTGTCSCIRNSLHALQFNWTWSAFRFPGAELSTRSHRNADMFGYRKGRYHLWDGSDELESLDFDDANNAFEVDACRQPDKSVRHSSIGPHISRWIITLVIGIGVAASAQLIQFLIGLISGIRNDFLQSWIDDERSATAWSAAADGETTALSRASFVAALFASYNALLVLVASIFTAYLEPSAATDGIAEIKVPPTPAPRAAQGQSRSRMARPARTHRPDSARRSPAGGGGGCTGGCGGRGRAVVLASTGGRVN